ncbi:hypothetical protein CEXT_671641 [Caerostris extrusa]|uniref:Uncharacterized protein n=1 Tax=Caerostris extrusa TaxID=172846 RepID=A0AAV4XBV5_CAEEX|nr:hypothetical protein CEXT_671641 [Caerostris extrusa]
MTRGPPTFKATGIVSYRDGAFHSVPMNSNVDVASSRGHITCCFLGYPYTNSKRGAVVRAIIGYESLSHLLCSGLLAKWLTLWPLVSQTSATYPQDSSKPYATCSIQSVLNTQALSPKTLS